MVTAEQVKELRDRTNAGIMDCKKVLVETDGNIEKAIEIFNKHVNKKDLVGIVMDSDMDGACSAAIIDMFCREVGMETKIYFHSGKQHGLHDKVEEIIKDDLSLIIIPDAGTNDVEDCRLIKDNNKDCDIFVCNGYTGNIILKTLEGSMKTIANFFKNEYHK